MYVRSCEESAPMFNGITYGMVNAAISMQLLKFVGLSFLLYQRFRRLCEILLLPEGEFITWRVILIFFIEDILYLFIYAFYLSHVTIDSKYRTSERDCFLSSLFSYFVFSFFSFFFFLSLFFPRLWIFIFFIVNAYPPTPPTHTHISFGFLLER